jgi:hypothetical protein
MIHKDAGFKKKNLIQRKNLNPFTKTNVLTKIGFLLEIFSKKQWNSTKILEISPNQSK